jgi:predicted NBD/HSP70 family sugar kinase
MEFLDGSIHSMKLLVDVGYTKTILANWQNEIFGQIQQMATYNAWMEHSANADQRKDAFLDWFTEQLSSCIAREPRIEQIGICLPGAINGDGLVARVNSLWGRASQALHRKELTRRIGRPVFLFNDLVAAAAFHGPDALRDTDGSALILNIGSGIGSKLYDSNRGGVILGCTGLDGEIGLSVVDDRPDATSMQDGSAQGTLGLYSSGSGFARLLREAANSRPIDAIVFTNCLSKMGFSLNSARRDEINIAAVESVRLGDEFTLEVLGRSIRLLVRALHVVVLFNSPSVIVVTGGFFNAFADIYRSMLCETLGRRLQIFYSAEDIENMVRAGRNDGLESLIGIARLLEHIPTRSERIAPNVA